MKCLLKRLRFDRLRDLFLLSLFKKRKSMEVRTFLDSGRSPDFSRSTAGQCRPSLTGRIMDFLRNGRCLARKTRNNCNALWM